jgi:mannose-6-phosphate isomerase-like protein (cupin superfamily)
MNIHVMQTAVPVRAGQDQFDDNGRMIWGLIPLSIKLSGKDTGGEVLMFEHRDMGKGGPPRHIHLDQDEWFYVVKGSFLFEVDGRMHRLGAGDTLFAPRNIPHGWAHVGEGPGTLLTMVSPVGAFEDFIIGTTLSPTLPSPAEVERAMADHNLMLVGPPLELN